MNSYLAQGWLLGFAIAAPVGPIGALCIRRTLEQGWTTGFVTGLGAAVADATYGSIAALGLTAVSRFLVDQHSWLSLIGGVFLCGFAMRTMWRHPSPAATATTTTGGPALGVAFATTFLLTLTNPMTILSFAAMFAGLGLGANTGEFESAGALIAGVFLGSATWWLALSTGVGLVRTRMTPTWTRIVSVASGLVILVGGIRALSQV